MNGQAPDFVDHVERTEPIRQSYLAATAFDCNDGTLERTVRDVIEELEFAVANRAAMGPEEFREAVAEQTRRLPRR